MKGASFNLFGHACTAPDAASFSLKIEKDWSPNQRWKLLASCPAFSSTN
jgi:hypothetical protein